MDKTVPYVYHINYIAYVCILEWLMTIYYTIYNIKRYFNNKQVNVYSIIPDSGFLQT